jgi:hypothetical protein
MRLADKRFRGPDREPWDPQRALTLGLRCGDVCTVTRTTFARIPFPPDIEMDKSMYWVPALMYEGTPAGHPCASIWLTTRKALALFPIGLRAKVHDPDT